MDKTQTIGKYQIQGQIGRGGFGTVFRAWDPTVARPVAIKVLTADRDADVLARFRNEAAAAGNLHHRNIVTVHDFGEHNGLPYIVMQLLEGMTLEQAIAKKFPFSLLQKMTIMTQVAAGLHHAHRHGVVHRDVKPANIMVLPDESVRIMDFGVARLSSGTSRDTDPRLVIGSLLYMAPELLSGGQVDHLADIWAFGAIFYELVAARHPFATGEQTVREVASEIMLKDPPPLRSAAPECPEELEQIVTRLLQKDRDLRYHSLEDVQLDLQAIMIELQKRRAQEMVLRVQQLVEAGQLEEAQSTTREVLQLDPENTEARSLLQLVRTEQERRLIQPRIQSLLETAERAAQSREFPKAIESLQVAWKLSGKDPAIEARLEELRRLHGRVEHTESLLAEARRKMAAHDFTEAFRFASEAARIDPANTSASELVAHVEQAIKAREQRHIDERISEVHELMTRKDYGHARALVDELAARFPNDPMVAELVASTRQNVEQRERALDEERVATVKAQTERLLDSGRFEEAIGLLEQTLREYPADPALSRLLALAYRDHSERRREESVRRVLAQGNEAERNGDAEHALQILEKGLAEHPDADILKSKMERLRQTVAERRRQEAIASVSERVTNTLAAGDLSQALQILDAARREFPGEPVFDKLAARAAEARAASEVDVVIARVRHHMERGEPGAALELVSAARRRFPSDARLLALEREVRAVVTTVERKAGSVQQVVPPAEPQDSKPAPPPKPSAERRHGTEIIDLEAIRHYLKKLLSR